MTREKVLEAVKLIREGLQIAQQGDMAKAAEMIGKSTEYLYLNPEDFAHLTAKADSVVRTGAVFRADVHVKRRDGRLLLARCAAKAIAPWDLARGVVWVMEDVTEQRADAARIAFLAHHDQLTGLPNRILLADRDKSGGSATFQIFADNDKLFDSGKFTGTAAVLFDEDDATIEKLIHFHKEFATEAEATTHAEQQAQARFKRDGTL